MRKTLADKLFKAIMAKYSRRHKFETAIRCDIPIRPYVMDALREKLEQFDIDVDYNQIYENGKIKKDRYTILIGRGEA